MIFVILEHLSLSLIQTLRTKLGFADESGFLLRYTFVLFLLHLLRELSPQLPGSPGTVTDDALDHLLRYSWPGNIREMRNVLERALLLSKGCDQIEAEHSTGGVGHGSAVKWNHWNRGRRRGA